MTRFNLSFCNEIAYAALKHADEIGKPISVAIVDSGSHLVCFKGLPMGK